MSQLLKLFDESFSPRQLFASGEQGIVYEREVSA
jgi:hypothetical protein